MSEDRIEIKKERDDGEETRRDFLKNIGVATVAGAAALGAGPADAEAKVTLEEHLQGHFILMTDEEKKECIERLEKRYAEEFEKKTTVANTPAMKDVLFGYALDISKCIGCRRCVTACVIENNQSRHDPEVQWIRVLKMNKGDFSFSADKLDKGFPKSSSFGDYGVQVGGNAYNPVGITLHGVEHYYEPEKVPEKNHFYFPVQCQQCEKPPCVKVCPLRTTFRTIDGIVVIDYNWCFGCRLCMDVCPYWARRFNSASPNLPREEMNPYTHYFGNRPRPMGVVEKCTFCIQRTRTGRYPACVEVCPVGARKFGNLVDPESEVRKVLAKKRVFRFKAEYNSYPKFFYFTG